MLKYAVHEHHVCCFGTDVFRFQHKLDGIYIILILLNVEPVWSIISCWSRPKVNVLQWACLIRRKVMKKIFNSLTSKYFAWSQ